MLLQQTLPALLKRLGPSKLIHSQLLPKVMRGAISCECYAGSAAARGMVGCDPLGVSDPASCRPWGGGAWGVLRRHRHWCLFNTVSGGGGEQPDQGTCLVWP